MRAHTVVGVAALLALCSGAYQPDRITSLPGVAEFDSLPFDQYSGYLKASTDGNLQLHYWFVTSQSQTPHDDPVVLWLNGGPGCSSLDGLLYEHGPLLVSPDGQTLRRNPDSWNLLANVLYLESPACVGFSYARDGNCTVTDDGAAEENYFALLSFFDKFPEYRANELFITGESYGGVYVPTLTLRIFQSDSGLNLKGFAVGNGLLSNANNTNLLITYAYAHGILGQELYQRLLSQCCAVESVYCEFYAASKRLRKCEEALGLAMAAIYAPGVNIYDVEDSCYVTPTVDVGAARKMQLTRQLFDPRAGSTVGLVPPCIDATGASIYLNLGTVREALHIPDSAAPWEICTDSQDFYIRQYTNMEFQFKTLVAGGVRGLVYNGDVDGACNLLGNSYFLNSLGIAPTTDYAPWKLGRQIAGYQRAYGPSLQFVTVRGAGHMVPQYKPKAALLMFKRFLHNQYYD